MAPKRKTPSSRNPSYDQTKFKSHEHQARFEDYFKFRKANRERGLELKEGEYPEIQEQIANRGWGKLVSYQRTSCLNIVREFYANAFGSSREEATSYVRGTVVPFDNQTISSILEIPQFTAECEYVRLLNGEVDPEEIRNYLCVGGQWKFTTSGHPKYLEKKYFRQIPKAWATIIQANILPASNTSEVIRIRSILTYAICNGLPVDIVSVIRTEMYNVANSKAGNLGHISLVYLLCKRAGVRFTIDNPIDPLPPLTISHIHGMDQAPGAEDNPPPAAPQPRRREREPTQRERMDELERKMSVMMQGMTNMYAMQRMTFLDRYPDTSALPYPNLTAEGLFAAYYPGQHASEGDAGTSHPGEYAAEDAGDDATEDES